MLERWLYDPAPNELRDLEAEMVSMVCKDTTRETSITLKTTGNEEARVSVWLAAKFNATKLKPLVVFKGAKREVSVVK